MTLLASFLVLLGCDHKPVYEDTRHLENPPPKPPSCPDLPELKNIALKDGSIADVRIVQFRETKLYLPGDMMAGHFLDKIYRPGGFVYKTDLQRFHVDIHSNECPGIVHVINELAPVIAGFGVPIGRQLRDAEDLTTGVSFALISPNSTVKESSRREGMKTSDAYIRFSDDVQVHYVLPTDYTMGSRGWAAYRESAMDLTRWLTTPPRNRDNDRIFALGAQDQ